MEFANSQHEERIEKLAAYTHLRDDETGECYPLLSAGQHSVVISVDGDARPIDWEEIGNGYTPQRREM